MRTPALTRRRFIATMATACTAAAAGGAVVGGQVMAQSAPPSVPEQIPPKLVPTVCGMCDVQCGLLAYVRGNRLDKLEGNHSHSHSLGHICARGSAAVKMLYDPDRLTRPLKRVAEGRFEPITWDQAFREIGAGLSKLRADSGAQSLAWVRHPDPCDDWDRQFAAAYGTPNLFTQRSLSQSSRVIASMATIGWVPVMEPRQLRYVLICGRNHGEAIFPADLDGLMRAKEAGGRIVVVDPRLSNTAAQAHEWISIRPGTDGALLLALINVIIAENLFDHPFVEAYVQGFDELRDYVADKTPGWAAIETDVPAATITRLARELAAAKPLSAVDPGARGAWGALYGNSLNTARAALVVNALLGAYGSAGALRRPLAASEANGGFSPPATPEITARRVDLSDTLAASLYPAGEGYVQALPGAIMSGQPYPIKAMVVRRANPALAWPNSRAVVEALRKLELLVVIDVLPSETSQYAHYILPESTFLERADPAILSRAEPPEVALRQLVVQPLSDTKSPADIITGLGQAAGLGRYFGFGVAEVTEARLKNITVDRKSLNAFGVARQEGYKVPGGPKFATPSGKAEISSSRLRDAGFDALPVYTPPLVKPAAANEFRLLTGRSPYHSGSGTHNNGWLHARARENRLDINASRAARLGISDGDQVIVRSEAGLVTVRAHLTETIHPQAVFLVHGFGARNPRLHLAAGCGVNDNQLVVDRIDGTSASAASSETIVTVAKA
ncbi:MAG: molybdopterin-containing oxidoreductase family protein [Chloroflexota bacterium]